MLSLAPSERPSAFRLAGAVALFAAAVVAPGATARAQAPAPPAQSPVERLGPSLVRVGNVRADTGKKEVSIAGTINEAQTLEFIAATKGGIKNYESAIQLDTNGINLNVALILVGLDPARSTPPRGHLDPVPPKGDPVEVWVDWDGAQGHRHVRAEELIYNSQTKQTLPEGPWVYTGSVFFKEANQFMADVEGPLIGFVHTPAALIDSPRTLTPGAYGANQFNPNLGLKVGDHVVVTIRALPR